MNDATTTTTQTTTTQVDRAKVMRVYSGRPGCMCGCRGKYTWAHEVTAEEKRGHGGNDDPVSAATATRIVNTMNDLMRSGIGEVLVDDDGAWISVETETRNYVAYYRMP